MAENLCLHVCQHYTRELSHLIQQENLSNLEIDTYVPVCMHLQTSEDALSRIDSQGSGGILLADCCVLNTNKSCAQKYNSILGNSNIGNCLEILVGADLLEYFSKDGGYLVSPGWLRHWKSHLQEWGFDQVTAREFFNECVTHIVLLDTGIDDQSNVLLSEFAEYINLPSLSVPVGLDHFRLLLLDKINTWGDTQKELLLSQSINQANEQIANYALAFDLISNLTRTLSETDAMREIDHIFKMLFSPKDTCNISIFDNHVKNVIPLNTPPGKFQNLLEWALNNSDEYLLKESNDGFYLRVSHLSETLGAIDIDQVAFPQYSRKYLNMGLIIAPLFGLAISKARIYRKLEDNETLLKHLASTDSLTGLYNRRHFLQTTMIEFNRAKRYGSPLSVIMLDIDDFKHVNDTYGHAVGDKVLEKFAHVLKDSLRESDIVSRLGGDEFIILLPETNLAMAMPLSQRLRKVVEDLGIKDSMNEIKITTSLGVATVDDSCTTVEDLLHRCDEALYDAKTKGRNLVASWKKH